MEKTGRRADAEPETSSIGDEMVCSQRRDEMEYVYSSISRVWTTHSVQKQCPGQ